MHQIRNISLLLCTLWLLLGSYKGYLALWTEGQPDPMQIFPCPVASLPEKDRMALEEGLQVRSHLELDMILEDFLS